jgi:hypothetical protein
MNKKGTTSMTHNKLHRGLATVLLLVASATIALTGCSDSAPGVLGQNQHVLGSCPKNGQLATLIDDDETGSRLDPITTKQDQSVIERVLTRTAVCGGRLTVEMFSSSSGSTATVFDQTIDLPGATDNARLLQVPLAVKKIMKRIRSNWAPALAALPETGTDVTGLYRLAGDYKSQLPQRTHLDWVVLTDGLNNLGGINLTSHALTPAHARTLAARVPVPNLAGVSVTVAGLGRVAGSPTPSVVIDGLVAFYDAVCADTHAAKCLSVTDWR